MNKASNRIAGLTVLAALVLVGVTRASAENMDPDDAQRQFAWAENLGWINLEPRGDGGPGVEVADFELTGWMWSENVGWISLSCKNRSTCHVVDYGVKNDGAGNLSGYAWAENVGWINFSPRFGGVTIDPATGEFAGEAWSENAGWIRFRSQGPAPFVVVTGWRCDPAPAPPTHRPTLTLAKVGGATELSWTAGNDATGYDVIDGDLGILHATGGDFAAATRGCLADDTPETRLAYADSPAPGEGRWLLVRAVNCGGNGTYMKIDGIEGESRDDGVAASGSDCP
jgi:hypothetical protein